MHVAMLTSCSKALAVGLGWAWLGMSYSCYRGSLHYICLSVNYHPLGLSLTLHRHVTFLGASMTPFERRDVRTGMLILRREIVIDN
jgi:hypothetical protein